MSQAFAYYDYEYDVMNDPDGEAGQINYNDSGDIDPAALHCGRAGARPYKERCTP